MLATHINDPKHWRDRAEEARAVAELMNDAQSKLAMLEIAKGYEHLAERAETEASCLPLSVARSLKKESAAG